jgi:hypothetical protein
MSWAIVSTSFGAIGMGFRKSDPNVPPVGREGREFESRRPRQQSQRLVVSVLG